MDTTWYTSPYIPMHHYPWCSGLRSRPCRISCRQKYLFLPYSHTLFRQKYHFSFDRSNMQIFTLNITRVVWPHVTNLLDLRYFCRHNPLFYHLNLIPWHYWGWQKNIYFLVNIFVRHTFSMSKSSIKTETVLTMTDMTESTELSAFKRQRMEKFSCVIVLFYRETNSKSGKIYLLATMKYTWCAYLSPPFIGISRHKSLQFVKKSNITLLPSLFMIL